MFSSLFCLLFSPLIFRGIYRGFLGFLWIPPLDSPNRSYNKNRTHENKIYLLSWKKKKRKQNKSETRLYIEPYCRHYCFWKQGKLASYYFLILEEKLSPLCFLFKHALLFFIYCILSQSDMETNLKIKS
jgi:hypothetical protein